MTREDLIEILMMRGTSKEEATAIVDIFMALDPELAPAYARNVMKLEFGYVEVADAES